MNRICIIVPTFPPHYKFAYRLMKSYYYYKYNNQADLYFVFTNIIEYKTFGEYKNALILPFKLSKSRNKGIINIKKLYALQQLKNSYDFLITLDDESEFIKSVTLYNICNQYFNNKVLYGNNILDDSQALMNHILSSCKKHFNNINSLPDSFDYLYFWFNQLCIYKGNTITEFFEKGNVGKQLPTLTYYDFDYYLYMIYLLLYQGFQIENLLCLSKFSIVEVVSDKELIFASSRLRESLIYQCSSFIYKFYPNDSVFLLLHLDRGER